MAAHFPVRDVVLEAQLDCVPNGRLPTELLVSIGVAGQLSPAAARAWNSLWLAGQRAGYDLTWTYGGTYRTFEQQERLFYQRWEHGLISGRATAFYNGGWWSLRQHVARAAVPGTSNHGMGIAVDVAIGPHPDSAQVITPALGWLLEVAEHHGWSWESQAEPWHIRYTEGDEVPQAVISAEAWIQAQ